jgi:hypothetical protein
MWETQDLMLRILCSATERPEAQTVTLNLYMQYNKLERKEKMQITLCEREQPTVALDD